LGLSEEQSDAFINACNGLSNLQLLQATQNIEKSDKQFSEWLSLTYTSPTDRDSFLMQNYMDTSDSLVFEDFLSFVATRRKALKSQFMNMLNVRSAQANDDGPQA
jgi:hypothetical protein